MGGAIEHWHEAARARDPAALDALLAEDAVFLSPVVHTPHRGKAITAKYLAAALRIPLRRAVDRAQLGGAGVRDRHRRNRGERGRHHRLERGRQNRPVQGADPPAEGDRSGQAEDGGRAHGLRAGSFVRPFGVAEGRRDFRAGNQSFQAFAADFPSALPPDRAADAPAGPALRFWRRSNDFNALGAENGHFVTAELGCDPRTSS